jgi:hypothetical protein
MSGPLKPIPLGTTAIAYETLARGLAEALRGTLPGHLGFTLFIFDQGAATRRQGERFYVRVDGESRGHARHAARISREGGAVKHCTCVRLNRELGIYTLVDQERAKRRSWETGAVADCRSARSDCPVCKGSGVRPAAEGGEP